MSNSRTLNRRQFLTAGAAAAVLAACGKQGPSATEAPAATEVAVEPSPDVAEATQDLSLTNLEQIERLSDSKINVRGWHVRLWSSLPDIETLNDQLFDQMMERITNVHVDWTSEAGGGPGFDAIMAGGDLPDMFALWLAPVGINIMSSYGMKGAFIPLNDSINANPYLSSRLIANPRVKAAITAPDGNIYVFPRILEGSAQVYNGLAIRQSWLDEVSMEAPKTMDELYEVAKAFKAQDATRYPITYGWHQPWPLWQFGVDNGFVQDGDKIVFGPLMAEYREALTYVNRLFAEGLIEPNWQNVTAEEFDKNHTTEVAGISSVNQDNLPIYEREAPEAQWVPMPMPEGPYGHHQNFENYQDIDRWSGNVIASTSKQQEILAKYNDFYFSDSGSTLSYYGVYGDTYTEENGKKVWTEKLTGSGLGMNEYNYSAISPNWFGACYMTDQEWIDLNPGVAGEAVRVWADNDAPAVTQSQMPDMILSEEEQEIVQVAMADINTLVGEYYAQAVMGEKNLDGDLVEMTDQIRTMGISEATAAYQSAFDRYLALNK